MAAYAVLVSLSRTLEDFIQRNPNQVLDQHGHIFQSLQQNVSFLQGVFDGFPQKVSMWEEKIHDSANEAELTIEDYVSRTICDEQEVNDDKHSLFHDVEKVGLIIESIAEEVRREIELDAGNGDDSLPAKIPFVNQKHEKQRLFGFEQYLTELRDCLLIHSSKLQIVPIVAMGGTGKTSLARAVFDDHRITNHFDLRRWVTVSQSYNVKAILLAILGIEEQSDTVSLSIMDLGVQVNQLLCHRRYLIVLDDFWDSDAWDKVQIFLRDDENRSRVLLTTRYQDLARYAKPSGSIYQLQLMNEETSWSLLKDMVFGEEQCPPYLVEIGQKIANGCGGLPLAIVVIAGIVKNMDLNQDSWENIAEDVNQAIRVSDGHFMDILGLSYQHMPHYLRPCFLYLSAFLSSEEIEVATLLKIWVAEGFIKPNKTSKEEEYVAYEYVEELLKRNLIFIMDTKYNGRIRGFGVHDLIRELSKKKSEEERFLHWNDDIGAGITTARRVSFSEREESSQFTSSSQPYLRSIICHSNSSDLLTGIQSFEHLRILHAPSIVSLSFPSHLLSLRHLRYLHLDFSPDDGFEVPPDISKLQNLETLNVRIRGLRFFYYRSLIIPVDIWKMSKLRHIFFERPLGFPNPTLETSPLVNLFSLGIIRNFRFTDETVKLIPNVRTLMVSYVLDSSWSDYDLSNLCRFTCLEMLVFYSYKSHEFEWRKENSLVKSLIFPSSLKELKFRGVLGASWEEMTRITGSLPNLQALHVCNEALHGDIWETDEDDFRNLRVLEINETCCLKCWRCKSSNPFPSLQRLVLTACPYLTQLPDGIGDIPTLESIIVDDVQEAIVNWAKQIQEEQLDIGNELLQVVILNIVSLTDKLAAILQEQGDKKEQLFEVPECSRRYGFVAFDPVIDNLRIRYPELWRRLNQSLY